MLASRYSQGGHYSVIMWSHIMQYCIQQDAMTRAKYRSDFGTCKNTLYLPLPQCTRQISHNAAFCNRNVHISVTKWCIVGYGTGALWDLCNRSVVNILKKSEQCVVLAPNMVENLSYFWELWIQVPSGVRYLIWQFLSRTPISRTKMMMFSMHS